MTKKNSEMFENNHKKASDKNNKTKKKAHRGRLIEKCVLKAATRERS
jgi:hypothetical protein